MDGETIDRTYGVKTLLVLAILGALATALMFRPRIPSGFAEHGAFGVGYGSESLMFGATARKGAAR